MLRRAHTYWTVAEGRSGPGKRRSGGRRRAARAAGGADPRVRPRAALRAHCWHALERLGNPLVCSEGEPVANTFPAAVWKLMEPLFRSALDGETRSREIWTPEQRHCLMVDVGPLRLNGADGDEGGGVAGGVAVVLD